MISGTSSLADLEAELAPLCQRIVHVVGRPLSPCAVRLPRAELLTSLVFGDFSWNGVLADGVLMPWCRFGDTVEVAGRCGFRGTLRCSVEDVEIANVTAARRSEIAGSAGTSRG